MIEILSKLTAITDPAANLAIIGIAYLSFKMYVEQKIHGTRITNLEREVFDT